jgi:hypothetical protein
MARPHRGEEVRSLRPLRGHALLGGLCQVRVFWAWLCWAVCWGVECGGGAVRQPAASHRFGSLNTPDLPRSNPICASPPYGLRQYIGCEGAINCTLRNAPHFAAARSTRTAEPVSCPSAAATEPQHSAKFIYIQRVWLWACAPVRQHNARAQRAGVLQHSARRLSPSRRILHEEPWQRPQAVTHVAQQHAVDDLRAWAHRVVWHAHVARTPSGPPPREASPSGARASAPPLRVSRTTRTWITKLYASPFMLRAGNQQRLSTCMSLGKGGCVRGKSIPPCQ